MKHKIMSAILLPVCLGGFFLAHAAKFQSASGELTANDAVALMRMINTAQAEAFLGGGSYLSLKKLLETPQFRGQQVLTGVTDDAAGNVKDYFLSVIASADGKHYQAKLVPAKGCGASFFTSDPGIVYQAQALGCGEK